MIKGTGTLRECHYMNSDDLLEEKYG